MIWHTTELSHCSINHKDSRVKKKKDVFFVLTKNVPRKILVSHLLLRTHTYVLIYTMYINNMSYHGPLWQPFIYIFYKDLNLQRSWVLPTRPTTLTLWLTGPQSLCLYVGRKLSWSESVNVFPIWYTDSQDQNLKFPDSSLGSKLELYTEHWNPIIQLK